MDDGRREVFPGIGHERELAARADAGVHAEHHLRAEGRREQELAEVLGEYGDGGLVGDLLEVLVDLVLDRGEHVGLVGEEGRPLEERFPGRSGHLDRLALEARDVAFVQSVSFGPAVDVERELFFRPAAAAGEVAVRVLGLRKRRDRLRILEIALKFGIRLRLLALRRLDEAIFEGGLAHEIAQALVQREHLDQDVLGLLEHRLDVGDLRFLVEELLRFHLERNPPGLLRALRAAPDPEREGFQARFLRLHRLGFPLLLERKVNLFEAVEVEGRADYLFELGRELFLFLDLAEDVGLALDGSLKLFLRLDHLLDHHLVHVARLLLAVAGDERDGAAFGG